MRQGAGGVARGREDSAAAAEDDTGCEEGVEDAAGLSV